MLMNFVHFLVFKTWLGFGIGGDHPLSATIMSKYANTKTRGAFIAAVFAIQGIGILVVGSVGIILSSIFNHIYKVPTLAQDPIRSTPCEADFLWRFIFALGAFPMLATFYYRMKMSETARYTALIEGNTKQAAADIGKVLHMSIEAGSCRHCGAAHPVQDLQRRVYATPRETLVGYHHMLVFAGHRFPFAKFVSEGRVFDHRMDPNSQNYEYYRIPKRPCAPETVTSDHIHPWSNLGLDNDGNILFKGI